MAQAIKQRHAHRPLENQVNQKQLQAAIDPTLLRAAGQIYRTYCEVNPNLVQRATGVVINQSTYRGMLLFSNQPILLPQEYFVPLTQLESGWIS